MVEIISNGTHQSFTLKMAQEMLNVEEFEGRPVPDAEFSFDGYKISGFSDAFGDSKRYIRPSDKNLVFQIILRR